MSAKVAFAFVPLDLMVLSQILEFCRTVSPNLDNFDEDEVRTFLFPDPAFPNRPNIRRGQLSWMGLLHGRRRK